MDGHIGTVRPRSNNIQLLNTSMPFHRSSSSVALGSRHSSNGCHVCSRNVAYTTNPHLPPHPRKPFVALGSPEDQTCITVAGKSRCPNLVDRHSTSFQPRRCHIDFLPTVHLAGYISRGALMTIAAQQMLSDLLECLRISGFGNCPKLAPIQETSQANELEKYTVKDTHLTACEAKGVILMVDQRNSDILVNYIRDSSVHQNIAVFASGVAGQGTENGEITGIWVWANPSHPAYCLQRLQDLSSVL